MRLGIPAVNGGGDVNDRSLKGLYNNGVRRLSRHRTGLMESNETWKPIETAPKDREIWVCGLARVWVDSCLFAWQGHACWTDDGDKRGWITGGFDDSGDFLFVEPTHYLKLPAHPFYDDPVDDNE